MGDARSYTPERVRFFAPVRYGGVSHTPNIPPPEHLDLLAQVVREVTTRRLQPADAEDFAQCIQVRLLDRNYDIFHRFTGRSSLATYLRVVVNRWLLDWRDDSAAGESPRAQRDRRTTSCRHGCPGR